MITTVPAVTPAATPAVRPVDGACTVCPHPVGSHDRISLRFCAATQAQAATRGCVCPTS